MKYAIVYSSQTGNTRLLAEAIRKILPQEGCIYFGGPSKEALASDRIYAGFWTDKGDCDKGSADFLKTLTTQEVFLFGTAGFGGSTDYFDKILNRTEQKLAPAVTLTGAYMCQGKMPMSVRARYEQMKNAPVHMPNLDEMIANFDKALSHPDSDDLEQLCTAIQN